MNGNYERVHLAFYGIAAVVRGYLIFRSSYIPNEAGPLLSSGPLHE